MTIHSGRNGNHSMTIYECPRCHKMVIEAAWETHVRYAHPRRKIPAPGQQPGAGRPGPAESPGKTGAQEGQ